jgi:hypothetical protein
VSVKENNLQSYNYKIHYNEHKNGSGVEEIRSTEIPSPTIITKPFIIPARNTNFAADVANFRFSILAQSNHDFSLH